MMVLAIFLAGCSHAERVNLLANRWNTGEHKKCTFLGPSSLICGGDRPLLRWEADDLRASLANSAAIERGEYDASFSALPTDYALWDCRKTGDSAVISCRLIRAPSADDLEAIRAVEEDGKKFTGLKAELADAEARSNAAKKRCTARGSQGYKACEIAAIKIAKDKEDSILPRLDALIMATKRDKEKFEQAVGR